MNSILSAAGFFRQLTALTLAFCVGGAALFPARAFADPPAPAVVREHYSPALLEMDSLIDEAPTLRAFLDNSALREKLYVRLAAYFGGEELFQRKSYDALLRQLDSLERTVPGYGEAVWKKRPITAPVVVDYNLSADQRYTMDAAAWQKRLGEIEEEHEARGKPFLQIRKENEREKRIAEAVKKFGAEVTKFQRSLNSAESRAKIEALFPGDARAADRHRKGLLEAFLKELTKEGSEAKALVSYAIYIRLRSSEAVRDALRNNDPTSVLKELKAIQDDFAEIFKGHGFAEVEDVPSNLRALARDMVPNAQKLQNNQLLFQKIEAGSAERATFYQVHRPFYGIFRGVKINECVGGGCGFLEYTSPARHSVPALAGVDLRFAEGKTGDFDGFVESVPVVRQADGKKFYSTILGYPRLRSAAFPLGASPSDPGGTTLFDLWLAATMKANPQPHLIGKSHSADNAHVLERARRSLAYLLGDIAGDSNDFRHLPENKKLVGGIVGQSQGGYNETYGKRGEMIIDAMLPDAGDLTVLRPTSEAEFDAVLREISPEAQRSFFEKTAGVHISEKQRRYRSVRPILDSPDPGTRAGAAVWILESRVEDKNVLRVLEQSLAADILSSGELGRLLKVLRAFPALAPDLVKLLSPALPKIPPEHWPFVIASNRIPPKEVDRLLHVDPKSPGHEAYWHGTNPVRLGEWHALLDDCETRDPERCLSIGERWLKGKDPEIQMYAFEGLQRRQLEDLLSTESLRNFVFTQSANGAGLRSDAVKMYSQRLTDPKEAGNILLEIMEKTKGEIHQAAAQEYFGRALFPVEELLVWLAKAQKGSNDHDGGWVKAREALARATGAYEEKMIALLKNPGTANADRELVFWLIEQGARSPRLLDAAIEAAPMFETSGVRLRILSVMLHRNVATPAAEKFFVQMFPESSSDYALTKRILEIRRLEGRDWVEALWRADTKSSKRALEVMMHLETLAKDPDDRLKILAKILDSARYGDAAGELAKLAKEEKGTATRYRKFIHRALELMDHPDDSIAEKAMGFLAGKFLGAGWLHEELKKPQMLRRALAVLERRPSPPLALAALNFVRMHLAITRPYRPIPGRAQKILVDLASTAEGEYVAETAARFFIEMDMRSEWQAETLVRILRDSPNAGARAQAAKALGERYATYPVVIEAAFQLATSTAQDREKIHALLIEVMKFNSPQTLRADRLATAFQRLEAAGSISAEGKYHASHWLAMYRGLWPEESLDTRLKSAGKDGQFRRDWSRLKDPAAKAAALLAGTPPRPPGALSRGLSLAADKFLGACDKFRNFARKKLD